MAYPEPIQKLIDIFTTFPGIGPRQASRFVFFILKHGTAADELISTLAEIKKQVGFCTQCFRVIEKEAGVLCIFCQNTKRDKYLIAIVEKESDMHNIEKTSAFSGLYHILGGVISPLDSNSPQKLHLKELHGRIKKILEEERECEVVFATSATTEGDTTSLYIERILAPLKDQHPGLKISRLGRGLSLGSELEYADEVTLKNALTNRK